MNNQQPQPFNPNEHLMKIGRGDQAKDYLPVAWRMVWFRDLCPNGTIETEMVLLDLDRETEEEVSQWNNETRRSEKVIKRANGFAMFRATVKDGKGGVATGTKSEKAASFPDYIEKAETGSIGRALAALGYGTQFTGDEFDERHRIVDAPVDRGDQQSEQAATPAPKPHTAPATAQKPVEKPVQVSAAPAKPNRAVDANVPRALPTVNNLKSMAVTMGLAHNLADWIAYKKSVLGQDVDDKELTEKQIKTLSAALDIDKPAKAS